MTDSTEKYSTVASWLKMNLDRDPNFVPVYEVFCPKCNKSQGIRPEGMPSWTCECGEELYLDPAGRLWGSKHLQHYRDTFHPQKEKKPQNP